MTEPTPMHQQPRQQQRQQQPTDDSSLCARHTPIPQSKECISVPRLATPTPTSAIPRYNMVMQDPFTSNIIHDTNDRNLVHAMAIVADAGAEAGAAADARSSNSSLHSSSSSSSSSSQSQSSTATTTYRPSNKAIAESNQSTSTQLNRLAVARPSIEIPQPQSPIGLHHALDGSLPSASVQAKATVPTRILPRSIESCVQETLAKDSHYHNGPTPYHGSGSFGQRRIMTPTSRLAETAVGVREVSKKIGK
ncbi:hypothetical protein BGZ51_000397 [Haplosporangium sp. Z 767]|nr:hypothetical protein BGZ51_000397 [Haplosporangium sp. Z 767]